MAKVIKKSLSNAVDGTLANLNSEIRALNERAQFSQTEIEELVKATGSSDGSHIATLKTRIANCEDQIRKHQATLAAAVPSDNSQSDPEVVDVPLVPEVPSSKPPQSV